MWLILVAALHGSAADSRTTVLAVTVGDASTGAFIADAEVRVPSIGRSARTKWDGVALIDGLAAGRYRVQVRAFGYAPGEVELQVSGDTAGVHFQLERNPTPLDTLRVVANGPLLGLAEFEARRKLGIGRFLTDSVLKEDRTGSLQSVLATRVPGIAMREHGIIATQPSGLAGDNECPVLIYYDGMQMESVNREPLKAVGPLSAGRRGGGPSSEPKRVIPDLERIRPNELAGVEIYSRTSAPQQYRPLGNYCKVVLLWTKW